MIVDSMTHEEVFRELERDTENLSRWTDRRFEEARKYALKHDRKKFPIVLTDKDTSPRRIKYYFVVLLFRRDEHEFRHYAYTIRHTPQGREVYLCRTYEESKLPRIIFTPHSLKRYSERSDNERRGDDLVMSMFIRSYDCAMSRNQLIGAKSVRYKGDMLISFCTLDGVWMGKEVNGIYIMNTFITYDMMCGLQKEVLHANLEAIKRGPNAADNIILKFNNRKSLRTNQPIKKRTNDKRRSNLSVE